MERDDLADAIAQARVGPLTKNIVNGPLIPLIVAGSMHMTKSTHMHVSVTRIANGYVVSLNAGPNDYAPAEVYYAEDLKAVGERIIALAVANELGSQQ